MVAVVVMLVRAAVSPSVLWAPAPAPATATAPVTAAPRALLLLLLPMAAPRGLGTRLAALDVNALQIAFVHSCRLWFGYRLPMNPTVRLRLGVRLRLRLRLGLDRWLAGQVQQRAHHRCRRLPGRLPCAQDRDNRAEPRTYHRVRCVFPRLLRHVKSAPAPAARLPLGCWDGQVRVRAVLQQRLYGLRVAVLRRDEQRRSPAASRQVHLDVRVLQQQLEHLLCGNSLRTRRKTPKGAALTVAPCCAARHSGVEPPRVGRLTSAPCWSSARVTSTSPPRTAE